MEYTPTSASSPVTRIYKLMIFIFIATTFLFSTAQAVEKKKPVAASKVKTTAPKRLVVNFAETPTVQSVKSVQVAQQQAQPTRPVQRQVSGQVNRQVSSQVSSLRGPAGVSDSQKSLEIRGQSRNLSMLLVLKNRHENIDFVKPRESYREEIQRTDF